MSEENEHYTEVNLYLGERLSRDGSIYFVWTPVKDLTEVYNEGATPSLYKGTIDEEDDRWYKKGPVKRARPGQLYECTFLAGTGNIVISGKDEPRFLGVWSNPSDRGRWELRTSEARVKYREKQLIQTQTRYEAFDEILLPIARELRKMNYENQQAAKLILLSRIDDLMYRVSREEKKQ